MISKVNLQKHYSIKLHCNLMTSESLHFTRCVVRNLEGLLSHLEGLMTSLLKCFMTSSFGC